MDLKLSKPIEVDGKKVETLSFNFEALTGNDYQFCERQALLENGLVPAALLKWDGAFGLHFAARACGIAAEILRGVGARDYDRLMQAVRDFFSE